MRMVDMKFYHKLTTQQKRELRKILDSVNIHTKKQIEFLNNSIMAILKERINNSIKVIKNEIPIEHYLKRNKYLSNYIKDFFNAVKQSGRYKKFREV